MLRTGAEVGDSELDVLSRLTDWLLDEGTSQWSESMEPGGCTAFRSQSNSNVLSHLARRRQPE